MWFMVWDLGFRVYGRGLSGVFSFPNMGIGLLRAYRVTAPKME